MHKVHPRDPMQRLHERRDLTFGLDLELYSLLSISANREKLLWSKSLKVIVGNKAQREAEKRRIMYTKIGRRDVFFFFFGGFFFGRRTIKRIKTKTTQSQEERRVT